MDSFSDMKRKLTNDANQLTNLWELGVERIFCGAELMLLAVPNLLKEKELRVKDGKEAFKTLIKEAEENSDNRFYRRLAEGRLEDTQKALKHLCECRGRQANYIAELEQKLGM